MGSWLLPRNGPLGTSTIGVLARVTYAGYYYDPVGRVTDVVDVGTNGGAAWTRPATVPARSDTVLVTSTAYDAAGNPADVTGPDGAVARATFDLLGRTLTATAARGTAEAPVRVRGEYAAFPDPVTAEHSVLGRDVPNNFDLVVSRRRDDILLLARPTPTASSPPDTKSG